MIVTTDKEALGGCVTAARNACRAEAWRLAARAADWLRAARLAWLRSLLSRGVDQSARALRSVASRSEDRSPVRRVLTTALHAICGSGDGDTATAMTDNATTTTSSTTTTTAASDDASPATTPDRSLSPLTPAQPVDNKTTTDFQTSSSFSIHSILSRPGGRADKRDGAAARGDGAAAKLATATATATGGDPITTHLAHTAALHRAFTPSALLDSSKAAGWYPWFPASPYMQLPLAAEGTATGARSHMGRVGGWGVGGGRRGGGVGAERGAE